jgi:DNA-binding transcriptional LysR family regulator
MWAARLSLSPNANYSTICGELMSATPPLRKLQYVLAVARELHFRKAAERLHVEQSSISRQIREVEEELGFEIFRRDNHLVALTDAGRAFILAVDDIMSRLDADFTRARDVSRLIARRNAASCLIGYSPFVPVTLRHEIRSIRKLRFPSIRLEFRLATESEMADSLGAGVFQAGVTFAPLERNHLQQIPLRSEPLHVVSIRGQSSNGNGSRAIRLAELRTRPLILPCSERTHPALHQWLHGQFASVGFRPNVAEEATSTQEVFDLVQDGVGIAIVPGGICEGMPPTLQCSPILGIEALRLVFLYRRRGSQTAQGIVSEIANSLRHAYLEKAG